MEVHMSGTTTTPTTFLGLIQDGYKSEDDQGHAGFGSTKEEASDALQHAQEVDAAKSEKTVLFGWHDKSKSD